jgi:hypothetical protein
MLTASRLLKNMHLPEWKKFNKLKKAKPTGKASKNFFDLRYLIMLGLKLPTDPRWASIMKKI